MLTIGITHWPSFKERVEYLAAVLESLETNLVDKRDVDIRISVLPNENPHLLPPLVERFTDVNWVMRNEHLGFAEHINQLKKEAGGHFFMLLQDDWQLVRSFELRPHVEFLESELDVAMLHFTATRGIDVEMVENWKHHRLVKPCSMSVYNDHPAIHAPLLRMAAGPMPEGKGAQGETHYNRIVRRHVEAGDFQVASLPLELMRPPLWKHIGKIRSVLRQGSDIKFAMTSFGPAVQHPDTPAVFERMFQWFKPELIIELGSGNGNFSRWMASMVSCEVHSFNLYKQFQSYHPLDNLWHHVGDLFSTQRKRLEGLLADERKTLLLCDNGNKKLEFAQFAPQLHSNDLVGVHDFGISQSEFVETMRKTRKWRCCEATWDDLRETAEGQFDKFWWDTMVPIAWAFFMKR